MAAVEFDNPAFLARLRSGDHGAFRQLVQHFHGALVGTAAGIIGSRAQAEEVVQDTWLAVFANIAGFEGRSSLATWLFTIATNRARTRARREGRMVPLALPAPEGEERAVPLENFRADGHWTAMPRLWTDLDPEREVAGRQLWQHVEAVIEQLPANQKAVLILRDVEGCSAEDACAMLEVSAENQRVLLHRARARVRRRIDALLAEGAPAAPPRAATARPATKPPRTEPGVARVLAWLRRLLRRPEALTSPG
jgi:RNA polymerase sigma-70 factor, ECF subfamily